MPKFKPCDYNQTAMVVINYQDQLQPGTFEHALHHLITDKLDLSMFYPRYQNEDGGRPAYDPAVLLRIILFASSRGITSSREIQWCCNTNIMFKALSCDSVPNWTTIANFIGSRSTEIEFLFEQWQQSDSKLAASPHVYSRCAWRYELELELEKCHYF